MAYGQVVSTRLIGPLNIPKMRDQQQTVQAVYDLQHEDVADQITPQRHNHDAGRERGLK